MTLDYADQKIRNRQQDSIWPLILLAAIMWTVIAVDVIADFLPHQETFDEYLERTRSHK